MQVFFRTIVLMFLVTGNNYLFAYPLDGEMSTGIQRLLIFGNSPQLARSKLPAGAFLNTEDINLNLLGSALEPDFDQVDQDPELKSAIESIFLNRDPSYSVTVIDITQPGDIKWAGVNQDRLQNPGSVGKILTMIGLFNALGQVWDNTDDRKRVLREASAKAGDWIDSGHHKIPRYDAETGAMSSSTVKKEDVFRLSEWLDHAVSASANEAGAIVWREAMLIKHFGKAYPVPYEEAQNWLNNTPKKELSELALSLVSEPLAKAGLNEAALRQGSFWTSAAKKKVPGTSSYASPRELARLLFRLEQGQLIDEWSSLEMKRYLYFTRKRYRYTYAPELNEAAVYFKSGSLYKCREEEGFVCGKYMGNVDNYMNSVVIVEDPAANVESQKRYIVALMSNVLKVNSAWDHSRIGAAIHEAIHTRTAVKVKDEGSSRDVESAGSSQ